MKILQKCCICVEKQDEHFMYYSPILSGWVCSACGVDFVTQRSKKEEVKHVITKVKSLDIPEINIKIACGKNHIHEDRKVPFRSILLWKKRGYKPHRKGIIHVRYEGIDKKYTFPLYFLVKS